MLWRRQTMWELDESIAKSPQRSGREAESSSCVSVLSLQSSWHINTKLNGGKTRRAVRNQQDGTGRERESARP